MVAHELKSPLSAIINYINVILTGMFDDNTPKVHEMLERCKVRGEALLDLVRDLLYINSREVGKVERSIEALDLKAVIAVAAGVLPRAGGQAADHHGARGARWLRAPCGRTAETWTGSS